jgi:group I intron endonuclease
MNWKLSEIKIGNKFNPEFKALENKPLIYKLLFPNYKVYIGHTKNIIKRIRSYIGINNETRLISNAIKKYAKEDISFTILEFCKEEELNTKEEFYVYLYNSNNKLFGYNLTKGGEFGFKITPQITKNKIMASNSKKKVASYNLQGILIKIYESITEAERDLNIKNSDIIRCCKCKNLRQRNGYMFSKDLEEFLEPYKRESVNVVKCFVFNKEGEFLSEHNSITNAAKHYNIPINFARTYILQGSLINKSFYISYTKDFKIPINKRSKLINVFEVSSNNKIDSIYGLKPCGDKYNLDYRTLHKYIHKNKEHNGLIFKYEEIK